MTGLRWRQIGPSEWRVTIWVDGKIQFNTFSGFCNATMTRYLMDYLSQWKGRWNHQ